MTKRVISANLKYEVVQRIYAMQKERGIRHFADAVEAYIEHLEEQAYPIIVRMGEVNSWQRP
jgi:hypothetical protein